MDTAMGEMMAAKAITAVIVRFKSIFNLKHILSAISISQEWCKSKGDIMNDIKIFENPAFGKIRTLTRNDELMFW